MKEIKAIVRTSTLEELKSVLFKMNHSGLTISQVMGCANQNGWTEYYRGSSIYMNVIPKVQINIVTSDEKVDDIIDAIIRVSRTGEVGDGKIFVTNVERIIRIRTGEEGIDAL